MGTITEPDPFAPKKGNARLTYPAVVKVTVEDAGWST